MVTETEKLRHSFVGLKTGMFVFLVLFSVFIYGLVKIEIDKVYSYIDSRFEMEEVVEEVVE